MADHLNACALDSVSENVDVYTILSEYDRLNCIVVKQMRLDGGSDDAQTRCTCKKRKEPCHPNCPCAPKRSCSLSSLLSCETCKGKKIKWGSISFRPTNRSSQERLPREPTSTSSTTKKKPFTCPLCTKIRESKICKKPVKSNTETPSTSNKVKRRWKPRRSCFLFCCGKKKSRQHHMSQEEICRQCFEQQKYKNGRSLQYIDPLSAHAGIPLSANDQQPHTSTQQNLHPQASVDHISSEYLQASRSFGKPWTSQSRITTRWSERKSNGPQTSHELLRNNSQRVQQPHTSSQQSLHPQASNSNVDNISSGYLHGSVSFGKPWTDESRIKPRWSERKSVAPQTSHELLTKSQRLQQPHTSSQQSLHPQASGANVDPISSEYLQASTSFGKPWTDESTIIPRLSRHSSVYMRTYPTSLVPRITGNIIEPRWTMQNDNLEPNPAFFITNHRSSKYMKSSPSFTKPSMKETTTQRRRRKRKGIGAPSTNSHRSLSAHVSILSLDKPDMSRSKGTQQNDRLTPSDTVLNINRKLSKYVGSSSSLTKLNENTPQPRRGTRKGIIDPSTNTYRSSPAYVESMLSLDKSDLPRSESTQQSERLTTSDTVLNINRRLSKYVKSSSSLTKLTRSEKTPQSRRDSRQSLRKEFSGLNIDTRPNSSIYMERYPSSINITENAMQTEWNTQKSVDKETSGGHLTTNYGSSRYMKTSSSFTELPLDKNTPQPRWSTANSMRKVISDSSINTQRSLLSYVESSQSFDNTGRTQQSVRQENSLLNISRKSGVPLDTSVLLADENIDQLTDEPFLNINRIPSKYMDNSLLFPEAWRSENIEYPRWNTRQTSNEILNTQRILPVHMENSQPYELEPPNSKNLLYLSRQASIYPPTCIDLSKPLIDTCNLVATMEQNDIFGQRTCQSTQPLIKCPHCQQFISSCGVHRVCCCLQNN